MTSALEPFEQHRAFLRGLAYRMTGSLADAEDVLQEAYLRWSQSSRVDVREPRAFLAKLVTHLCLDHLKSARARRESYVGPWLPEPVLEAGPVTGESATELAEDISMALLLALERLSALERAAFLLHDVFGYEHTEVAEMLGRDAAACRKLSERARNHVRGTRARARPTRAEFTRVLAAFGAAIQSGDAAALSEVLVEDAVLLSDGGGRVSAALKPILGSDKIARFLLGLARKRASGDWSYQLRDINGLPGFLLLEGDRLEQAMAFEVDAGRIVALYMVRNPDKLRSLAPLVGARLH